MFTDAPAVADERQLVGPSPGCPHISPEYRIESCGQDGSRRADAEEFVRKRFRATHGAHIATFMPTLLLLTGADDRLVAVAGFRCAAHEPLFLERPA